LKKIFKIPNISNHIGVKFIPIFINRTKKRFLVQKMHVPFGPGTYILSGSRDNSYKPPSNLQVFLHLMELTQVKTSQNNCENLEDGLYRLFWMKYKLEISFYFTCKILFKNLKWKKWKKKWQWSDFVWWSFNFFCQKRKINSANCQTFIFSSNK